MIYRLKYSYTAPPFNVEARYRREAGGLGVRARRTAGGFGARIADAERVLAGGLGLRTRAGGLESRAAADVLGLRAAADGLGLRAPRPFPCFFCLRFSTFAWNFLCQQRESASFPRFLIIHLEKRLSLNTNHSALELNT